MVISLSPTRTECVVPFLCLQTWSYVSKPNQLVRGAHDAGSETTSLSFSQDGNMLLSRNMEGTLKLWDLRK
jgi:WD40 repeat protein